MAVEKEPEITVDALVEKYKLQEEKDLLQFIADKKALWKPMKEMVLLTLLSDKNKVVEILKGYADHVFDQNRAATSATDKDRFHASQRATVEKGYDKEEKRIIAEHRQASAKENLPHLKKIYNRLAEIDLSYLGEAFEDKLPEMSEGDFDAALDNLVG